MHTTAGKRVRFVPCELNTIQLVEPSQRGRLRASRMCRSKLWRTISAYHRVNLLVLISAILPASVSNRANIKFFHDPPYKFSVGQ